MRKTFSASMCCALGLMLGCSRKPANEATTSTAAKPAISYYKVNAANAGSVTGTVRFNGKKPAPKVIDMSSDPACVEAHHGKAFDESLMIGPKGAVGNAFVYIKSGLEGKNFEPSTTPVVIDQRGCWFHPRVLGIQTNQPLQVINSDPVTHNIHPMAQVNREWNHSQGPEDPPITRKFLKPEVMIPVKCNIHSWMHDYIGVLDHPYFAVTAPDGSFEIKNLPAGTYTIGVWQEKLGTQEQTITISPQQSATAEFRFKPK
jgi:Polysaccharide lyase family 4, domain II